MGSFSLTHWIVVAIVVLVLFGRGKISETMGDFGKGIRSFRKGLSEEGESAAARTAQLPRSESGESVDSTQKTAAGEPLSR